jgi:hypothetical protein
MNMILLIVGIAVYIFMTVFSTIWFRVTRVQAPWNPMEPQPWGYCLFAGLFWLLWIHIDLLINGKYYWEDFIQFITGKEDWYEDDEITADLFDKYLGVRR